MLLGDGRVPDELRNQLSSEGLLLLDERLTGSLTFRDYRSPTRRSGVEKIMVGGAIGISRRRVVVWISGGKPSVKGKHMDVPLEDPRLRGMDIVAETPEKICLAYDPHEFRADTSGRVEVRFTTSRAAEIVVLLDPAA